ncbi:hypothetical protein [Salinibacterium sp. ZJ70]|uniref:hypothetical protein n=1 Tax=Salinibacterium sp. ZJ70 TaxID=2708084 RepID=UPI00142181D6|nr:hypothetical protein [Salinibacterium sp. ZJ70]
MNSLTAPRVAAPRRSSQPVASHWPLVMGAAGLASGIALAAWTAATVTEQPFSGEFHLWVADDSTHELSIAGYLLTPFVVIGALIWDRIGQRLGLRDRNFGLKPRYTRALQGMAMCAMVVGAWHIYNIAYLAATA